MTHNNPSLPEVTSATRSPRETLLDTAETLYAAHGFHGVSLRQLTQAAGTNLAAVNYHFGSKEQLFVEVLARRLRPINARRLELLDAILARAADGAPRLEDLLDALARPFFEVSVSPGQSEPLRRLLARVLMEVDSVAIPLFENELLPVAKRFGLAISQARPDLPRRCILMGMMFFAGAMVNLLASRARLQSLGPMIGGMPDDEEMLQALVRYGAAGITALAGAGGDTSSSTEQEH